MRGHTLISLCLSSLLKPLEVKPINEVNMISPYGEIQTLTKLQSKVFSLKNFCFKVLCPRGMVKFGGWDEKGVGGGRSIL